MHEIEFRATRSNPFEAFRADVLAPLPEVVVRRGTQRRHQVVEARFGFRLHVFERDVEDDAVPLVGRGWN
ncbi:hypothetical protein [Saccharopolyspora antimicrobica]|uniref:hypothetical protein n=1 Tax=Saccharopolyspora antimicrobica TaxID=455193 RepID=UPI001160D2A2|nr:hypothetical protein [Saccharopolyspora antimicrobica]